MYGRPMRKIQEGNDVLMDNGLGLRWTERKESHNGHEVR